MKKRGRIVAFLLIVVLFLTAIGTTVTGVSKNINLGLDLQGGFEILYEVSPVDEDQEINRNLLEATVETLNDRVNRLGISETVIDIEGDDRIRVQLAGVDNQEEAREMLSTSALLTFRDVDDKKLMDGTDIKEGSAQQDFDPNSNDPIVTLKPKDSEKFGDVTKEISEKTPPDNVMAIWMDYEEGDSYEEESKKEAEGKDPKYTSAPRVSEPLYNGDIQITGDFSVEEAEQLADIINSGSLPVHMDELFSTSVGAQFGEQALNKTVIAGLIGVGAIMLFMMAAYRFTGLIASINLIFYIFIILVVFDLMNGVLTLPGIAALILGVGMAVDANVLTFERVKEELRLGKSVKAAFKAGGKNALVTILDANITTMLAAAVLFIFGTSSIKGFATMLIVSILASFLTAVYGTRLLLGMWVESGFLKNRKTWFGVKKSQIQDINSKEEVEPTFFNRTINVVKHRKKIFTFSITLLVAGAIVLSFLKLNPGIDFTSGSRIEAPADESLQTEEIEDDLDELGLEAKAIVISGDDDDLAVMRFDSVLSEDQVTEVTDYFADKYGKDPSVSVVSPIVGQELVMNAIYALAIASVGMILYVTMRFEFFFALTAIIALLHDVFFMLVVFSLTRIEFDVTIIAAILTVIGYSINNTIVVFDRIRENIRAKDKAIKDAKELAAIVNKSLMQTFMRSINTTVTTLVAVLAFMILGAQPIFGFALALVVGLFAGAYSSLFLASQLWLVFRSRKLKEKPVDFRKKKRVEGPQV
ncbi:MAG TPA: protein translocase subunit SecDF [Pseudogracilibacillus sp.]|nr:protein translocase subunit SecDF [Pseudogracilibacillus sp.]